MELSTRQQDHLRAVALLPVNQPAEYEKLSPEEKAALAAWIAENLVPHHREWGNRTSYVLKHDFADCCGFYVTNGAFKGAMRAAGYEPVDGARINWTYKCRPNPGSPLERKLRSIGERLPRAPYRRRRHG